MVGRKFHILFFAIFSLFATMAVGQGLQSKMRVSVNVVKGSTIQMERPGTVVLQPDKEATLGNLTLNGIADDRVWIKNPKKVKISDKEGNEIVLDITRVISSETPNEKIGFKGISHGKMVSSVYTGELKTTIEYF